MITEKNMLPIQKCYSGIPCKELSDVELLSIILGNGSRSKDVFEIASNLYYENAGLYGIFSKSISELISYDGIGPVKAVKIQAALELGRRIIFPKLNDVTIDSPSRAWREVISTILGEKQETFIALILNRANQLLTKRVITLGTVSETLVHPREIFKEAIRESASSIIVCHNHPSGELTPSENDIQITKRLIEAGKIIGIELLDHIIATDNDFLSLKEEGYF